MIATVNHLNLRVDVIYVIYVNYTSNYGYRLHTVVTLLPVVPLQIRSNCFYWNYIIPMTHWRSTIQKMKMRRRMHYYIILVWLSKILIGLILIKNCIYIFNRDQDNLWSPMVDLNLNCDRANMHWKSKNSIRKT